MAKKRTKKRNKSSSKNRRVIAGALAFIAALILLVSLISHSGLDDARITGDADNYLDPFEIQFRNEAGMLGAYVSYSMLVILGWLSYFIPIGLILLALRMFSSEMVATLRLNTFLLFVVAVLGTVIYNVHLLASPTVGYETGAIGGYLTQKLTGLMLTVFGQIGTYIVSGGTIIILILTYTSVTPLLAVRLRIPGGEFLRKAYGLTSGALGRFVSLEWLSRTTDNEDAEDAYPDSHPEIGEESSVYEEGHDDEEEFEQRDDSDLQIEPADESANGRKSRRKATIKRSAEPEQIKSVEYTYPGLDLMAQPDTDNSTVTNEELEMTARMLKETLETFQVSVQGTIAAHPGPVITRFEFKPAAGVKINRIVSLADDLALALKAKRIRIVAPIPGKAAVGIEIPNRHPQMVFLRDIIDSDEFHDSSIKLPLALGKTISGHPFVADLARMPHLLIAGATGSGKSVCMNAVITSIIYRLHPMLVRFVFIDPKMLELSVYSGLPHMGRPVVTKPKRAEQVLSDIVVEMEKRYRRLANAGVRNIEDFNKQQRQAEEKLPYIIVCVDELADLMMSATSSKVETLITRLAQMARAVGIHLILATQRPSVDVITGLIKANFPARIAFQVSSKVDSRTIIDANGAEKLLGSGDMLFLNSGQPEPQRLHGAYISSEETDRIVSFIKEQGLEPMRLESINQSTGEATEADVDLGDPLFKEACEVVIRHRQGSVSLLQRRLGIGYQRAARLIDKLEQAGVVSPFDGSKARDVLVDQNYLQTLFAQSGQVSDQSS